MHNIAQTYNIKKWKHITSKNTTADTKSKQKRQHNIKIQQSGKYMEHKHPTGEESREDQPFKENLWDWTLVS